MDKAGLYLVNVEVGDVGTSGAPLLHLGLLVYTPADTVTGHAEITQAIHGPGSDILVKNLHGNTHALGFGSSPENIVVTLRGTYTASSPPPAIVVYQAEFEAVLMVDKDWSGKGYFTYGAHRVGPVPVRKV